MTPLDLDSRDCGDVLTDIAVERFGGAVAWAVLLLLRLLSGEMEDFAGPAAAASVHMEIDGWLHLT